MIAFGPGATRRTSSPGTSSRRSPCQPTVTNASSGAAVAHTSGSSAATGESSQPWLARQASGTTSTGSGSDASWATWRRPSGRSMFTKTGPRSSSTSRSSTPASRNRSSSWAVAASASTPTMARVGSPSRATVRALYETPPPSRQPRGSLTSMSRLAAPTTRTAGRSRAGASVMAAFRGPAGANRILGVHSFPFPRSEPACTSTSFTKVTRKSSRTSSSATRPRWTRRSSSKQHEN